MNQTKKHRHYNKRLELGRLVMFVLGHGLSVLPDCPVLYLIDSLTKRIKLLFSLDSYYSIQY